ncbi:hypothetical protein BGZ63DRAFT_392947 [Mariannaea sp. PMI_226]|nr:hypothetical protein BGZ63DRAFT_392947 [Mariannaea sp. PMI_226]
MNKYGMYAQHISVEVDLSRLGCGSSSDAAALLPGLEHIEALIHDFVQSQLRRDTRQPVASLILLCRRFYGERYQEPFATSFTERSSTASNHSRLSHRSDPLFGVVNMRTPSPGIERTSSGSSPVRSPYFYPEEAIIDAMPGDDIIDTELLKNQEEDKTPASPYVLIHGADYCPDSYLTMCDSFLHLRGLVDSLRMCGFGETYTNNFITSFFSCNQTDMERSAYRVSPSTIWPRLSGQKSYVDVGEGQHYTLDDHSAVASGVTAAGQPEDAELIAWEGCVQLPPLMTDSCGNARLPPVVSALLQKTRLRTLDTRTELPLLDDAKVESGSVGGLQRRRTTKKLFNNNKYSKAMAKKKRSFSREVAATM